MGVDFLECYICESTFADCSDHGYCEGCGRYWCGYCKKSKANRTFLLGNEYQEPRCELCCNDKLPEHVTDAELLEFTLEQQKKTRSDIYREWQLAQGVHLFMCDHCDITNCESLSDYYEVEEDHQEGSERERKRRRRVYQRGLCCVLHCNYTDEEEWCDACRAHCVQRYMEEPMEPIFDHYQIPRDVRRYMYSHAREGGFFAPDLLESWEKAAANL